ncbi:MAG: DUF3560 domain-containing protein [Verrucomicrobiales bacterium]|nr:DUF3560 domain-containing protein [Verrucomicrobiales bacterium]
MDITATYSPEDNKLRLYPVSRLSDGDYTRVREAGYIWAAKQGCFVAPMWTPEREDIAIELAGDIDDEDKSLVERAEERADRFREYNHNRLAEANAAHSHVASISDGIPLGQPILVGHHSEARARRDAERIQSGMRKAVRLWETAEYWKERAAGAIRAAKYKERPDVRARRIKKLESEKRGLDKLDQGDTLMLGMWEKSEKPLTKDRALAITGTPVGTRSSYEFPKSKYPTSDYEGRQSLWGALNKDTITPDQAMALDVAERTDAIERRRRWINHLHLRLEYERAMLAEQVGTVADRTGPEVGGACRCWASPNGGWSYIVRVNKVSVTVRRTFSAQGRPFNQVMPFDKLLKIMTKQQVDELRAAGRIHDTDSGTGFFVSGEPSQAVAKATVPTSPDPEKATFEAMKASASQEIKVVTADQLFPTPPELARQAASIAQIGAGQRVLEPSAGTGELVKAVIDWCTGADLVKIVAVEVNPQLAQVLRTRRDRTLYANDSNYRVVEADFLSCNGDLGTFHRVLMNPPFSNGADIKHIQHAAHFLKPGGILVAFCANGPRQQEILKPWAEASGGSYHELPDGSFKASGTNVRTALLKFINPIETEHATS